MFCNNRVNANVRDGSRSGSLTTLSLYTVIGLFLLMGIVKKNGIMIVDFALRRIDEGYDFRLAIHEASVERFRPIIMTTLAALLGAVPLALGYGAAKPSPKPLGAQSAAPVGVS
jgi:multidrug efflux pump subunit AcrB